jgi:hypothetical protein
VPWHQNHDKSSKNTENLIKPWKRRGNRESHLTVDCLRTYNRFERLVCNQEVARDPGIVSPSDNRWRLAARVKKLVGAGFLK